MSFALHKAAVLGAGTMGSRIAAHLANAGLGVVLLDLPGRAEAGLEAVRSAKPSAFFDDDVAVRVTTGSFDDADIGDCEWIVEAVAEDLEIKRAVLRQIAPRANPKAVFSTNTSGLSVNEIASTLPASVRQRWLGIHFFNPPRYMRLVEVVPGSATDPQLISSMREWLTSSLGKTVVLAKDTPNFIANRIGIFALLNNVRLMEQYGLSVEEVDAMTAASIGWPGTATFRLMDLIGLDVLVNIDSNFRARTTDERSDVAVPQWMRQMVERGWLGDKAGQGFYKRSSGEVLDWRTLEYKPLQKLQPAREANSEFQRQLLQELHEYALHRIPEIADDADAIDTAMRAGFNWQRGPIEMMAARSQPAPKILKGNDSISAIDMGDGVVRLELHTKMNAVGDEIVSFLIDHLDDSAEAYVIGGDGPHFSAGANLGQILALIEARDWSGTELFITRFQRMTQAIKFCPRPVVAAAYGLCLGGGAETVLHSAARVVHCELSMGLVEIAVGLIPGGGGCKELALRATDGGATWPEVLSVLTSGARSQSALQARRMRLLTASDEIVMNRELLLQAAKRRALALAAHYSPPEMRWSVPGAPADLSIEMENAYDAFIASRLVYILRGQSEEDLLAREREVFVELCAHEKTRDRIAHMLKTGKR